MPGNQRIDDLMREMLTNDKRARRYYLRKLINEAGCPGKSRQAMESAERWFGVSTVEELQKLLDEIPKPRTTTKRGRHARASRETRRHPVESWEGQSVPRQEVGHVG